MLRAVQKFLNDTHKGLGSRHGNAFEIRMIERSGKGIYSVNIEDINSQKGMELLNDVLCSAKYRTCCKYFSLYDFKRNGALTRISNSNAENCSVLSVDFDHIDENGFRPYLDKLHGIGLDPYVIFSGHGYQLHFILDRVYNTKKDAGAITMQQAFRDIMLRKGFPVDTKVGTASQIMRLPFTYNCKDPANPIKTEIIRPHGKDTFSFDGLICMLEALPDNPVAGYKPYKATAVIRKKRTAQTTDVKYTEQKGYDKLFTKWEWDSLPEGIKNILKETFEGERNYAEKHLVNFLYVVKGYSETRTLDIISEWAGYHCIPALPHDQMLYDFNRFIKWSKANKPEYNRMLKEAHGSCYGNYHIERLDEIQISEKCFSDFKKISGGALKLFFAMIYMLRNNVPVTKDILCPSINCSQASFYRYMDELKARNIVRIVHGNKKTGSYTEYIPVYEINQQNSSEKYFTVPYAQIERFFTDKHADLTNTEFKIYITLIRYGTGYKNIWISQENIGRLSGYCRQTVSAVTSILHNLKYIFKNTRVFTYRKKDISYNGVLYKFPENTTFGEQRRVCLYSIVKNVSSYMECKEVA